MLLRGSTLPGGIPSAGTTTFSAIWEGEIQGVANRLELIGHRGASHDAPENTLASIRLAWAQEADAVEVDVFLTKDSEIAVIHDETTQRYGGPDRAVADQTLAELKQIDIGRWKGEQWSGERIPTLAEVLAALPDGKRILIEIKCGLEIVPRLTEVLAAAKKAPDQTCLISFPYDVIAGAKKRFPALDCYWIVELEQDKQSGRWSPAVDELIREAQQAGLDGLDLGDVPVIDREFVAKIKRSGLAVYIWTVDSAEEASRLRQAGVDGIATNRPGSLKELFR